MKKMESGPLQKLKNEFKQNMSKKAQRKSHARNASIRNILKDKYTVAKYILELKCILE